MNLVLFDRRRSLGSVVKEMLKGVTLRPGDTFEFGHWERSKDDNPEPPYNGIIYCFGVPASKLDDFLASPIEKLELYQTRWFNALHDADIHFVGQLVRMWWIHIQKTRGIGKQGAQRISYALRPYHVHIRSLPCGKKELKKLRKVRMPWLLRVAQISDAYTDRRKIPKKLPNFIVQELADAGIRTIGDLLSSNRQYVKRYFRRARAKAYFQAVNSRKYKHMNYWNTKRVIKVASDPSPLFKQVESFLTHFELRIPDVTPRPQDPLSFLD